MDQEADIIIQKGSVSASRRNAANKLCSDLLYARESLVVVGSQRREPLIALGSQRREPLIDVGSKKREPWMDLGFSTEGTFDIIYY